MFANEATHVLLDPGCELNNVFRSGLPGKVVSLAWARESYFQSPEIVSEQDYLVSPLVDKSRVVDRGRGQPERRDVQLDRQSPVSVRVVSSTVFSGSLLRV